MSRRGSAKLGYVLDSLARLNGWAVTGRLLGVMLVLSYASCGAGESRTAPERTLQGYFSNMRDGHIDSALAYYHPQFFRTTPRSAWSAELERVLRLLGPLKDYRLHAYTILMSPDTVGLAMAQFAYTVAYERDSSREFFVLRVPAEGNASIVAHRIGSDALLEKP